MRILLRENCAALWVMQRRVLGSLTYFVVRLLFRLLGHVLSNSRLQKNNLRCTALPRTSVRALNLKMHCFGDDEREILFCMSSMDTSSQVAAL